MRIVVLLVSLFCAAGAQTSGEKLEFEVASVKASAYGPGADGICRGGPGSGDPALFSCRYVDLNRIIVRAFGLRPFQVAAPDWTLSQRFDIQVTVPTGATKEQFEAMLRHLLIERFRLAFHWEPREMTRYELLVAEGGPKLREAQDTVTPPEGTPPIQPGLPSQAVAKKMQLDKDGYPIITRQGWSTVDGRARFYQPSGGFGGLLLMLEMMMETPVADATGLKGNYEIEMHWVGESPISGRMRSAMAQARANTAASPDAQATAPDPSPRGPTIQQALRDQLGLKLQLKKGPVETLVVDHINRAPTDN